MNYLIIGDSCKDIFIYGEANRLSPEAPIPVFTPIHKRTDVMGMGGNVFLNLMALINRSDSTSTTNLILSQNNVTKTRYVDFATNHYFLRVDEGSVEDRFKINNHIRHVAQSDCIIISDYDKGFISESDILDICKFKGKGTFVFLDTKKVISEEVLQAVDYIKFNKKEYEAHNKKIPNLNEYLYKIIITLGGDGVMYRSKSYLTDKVVTMDVSGAGDTFLSALCYYFMEHGFKIETAIPFANDKALEVVKKRGVACI
jgi:bifunctional ADP-heptose synthase (sugar kinase/adenylyltransferase)